MDAQFIEKLDRQRYRAVILETVGLLLVFVESLWIYICDGFEPEMFIFTFGGGFFGTGLILLIAGGVWYGLVFMKARRDRQVKKALYNEMYREHKHRYQRASLWIMIGVAILTMLIIPPRYPHLIMTEMIVLSGLLTMKILWLIYNRR